MATRQLGDEDELGFDVPLLDVDVLDDPDALDLGVLDVPDAPDLDVLPVDVPDAPDLDALDEPDLDVVALEETAREMPVAPTPPVAAPVLEICKSSEK